ncbi:unnamed protein product [Ixodes hexagonus]
MLLATIVSTLVIIATIYYLFNRSKAKQVSTASSTTTLPSNWGKEFYSSALIPKQTTMTTYTMTSAMCPLPEDLRRRMAPLKATGDVSLADAGQQDFAKKPRKQDPDAHSYGEGMQQPYRDAPLPHAEPEHHEDVCDIPLSSLDINEKRWVTEKLVGLQSHARGMLLRRALLEYRNQRRLAASKIQAWWRAKCSEALDADQVFMRKYEAMLETAFYKVYQSEESEVTWSAEETDMLLDHSDDSTDGGSELAQSTFESPPRRTEESDRMFGDLMIITDQKTPLKFADVMASLNAPQGCVKIAEGTHSDIFRIDTIEGATILKVISLEFIVKYWDTLYAEALISLELGKLRKRADFHTSGFSDTKRIFCLLDRYPRELIQAWRDYTSWKRTDHQHGPGHLEMAQPYMVFCSSYGGIPLTQVKIETTLQLRSILQQVALSLAVAEAALQFEHRDLSLSHVLVDGTQFQLAQYCLSGKSIFVNTWGVAATIVDFAASRIKECQTGQVIFSNLSHGHPCESRHSNVYSIYNEIGNLTKGNWSGYYPRTNVACLVHLTNQLYQAYQAKFVRLTDLMEAEAWAEIHNWRLSLPEYRSVVDFVRSKFRFSP